MWLWFGCGVVWCGCMFPPAQPRFVVSWARAGAEAGWALFFFVSLLAQLRPPRISSFRFCPLLSRCSPPLPSPALPPSSSIIRPSAIPRSPPSTVSSTVSPIIAPTISSTVVSSHSQFLPPIGAPPFISVLCSSLSSVHLCSSSHSIHNTYQTVHRFIDPATLPGHSTRGILYVVCGLFIIRYRDVTGKTSHICTVCTPLTYRQSSQGV